MQQHTETTITIAIGNALGKFLAERPLRQDFASMTRILNDDEYEHDFDAEISESTALNRLAERYDFLLRQNFPKLPEEAWMAILSAYNPRTEHALTEMRHVFSGVCDDIGLELQDDETNEMFWDRVKKAGLGYIPPISKLTEAENFFVYEFIEHWWGRFLPEEKTKGRSLRHFLSKFSGVSPEQVFAD